MSIRPRVVFLANDAVFEQGLAFLESFRVHNPDLQLSMIPYAEDIENLEKLQRVYNFDILSLDFERWDALSRIFFPGAAKKFRHRLRKLSIFDVCGPATIYLDLDIVVLKDLSFLAEPLVTGKVDFICTATGNDPWVYKTNFMNHAQLRLSRRFSDGFFAFNSDRIDAQRAYDVIVQNTDLYLSVRADDVYCQPLTNFIVDMLRLKLNEVFTLFPNISSQVWYAGQRLSLIDNRVVSTDGKEVLFVHWAGPVDTTKDFRFKELFQSYLDKARQRMAARGITHVL